ncbi:hypothetical protein H4582DRAFT_2077639 [Lactarius indigo]|nr:hypothetical protein H4582DRAFT_2077639 [Lactarius indigo]
MSDDFLLSLPSGPGGFGADAADLPSFTPPPQAAPDLFEKDLDNVALDVQFLTLDDIFPPSPSEFTYTMQSRRDPATSEYSSMTCSTSDYSAPFDFGPPPGLTSSTESIYTTQSSEDPATSEYSSMTYSTSSYPALPLDDFVSQLDAVDPKLTMFSDPSPFFDSSGLQLSPPPSSPDVYVFEAQSDDVHYPPPIGISPQILSATFKSPTPPYPTDSPVRAASIKGSRTGPIRTNETLSVSFKF